MRDDTRTSSLKTMLDEYERRLIRDALVVHAGNQRRAAAALGVLPTTLHEKMKRLGLVRHNHLALVPDAGLDLGEGATA